MKKIVVLGAGIAGLATAWFLKKRGPQEFHITLIEKSDRSGGWIETTHQESFTFERGARGCRPQALTLQLVKDLGLGHELAYACPEAKKRYILKNQTLVPLPTHPLALLSSPLCKGLFASLWKERKIAKTDLEDETIEAFVLRRLSRPILDNLIDPLVKGIFAGDPAKLSMRACFPKMWEMEQTHGSLVKALFSRPKKKKLKGSLFSFKRGMHTLPFTLEKKLKELGVVFQFNTEVTKIEKNSVTTAQGPFKADAIFSALSVTALARLVSTPCFKEERKDLAVVNLGYRSPIQKPKGFGFLVPSSEKKDLLGITFDSDIFSDRVPVGGTSMTAMMLPTEDPLKNALKNIKTLLGIDQAPDIALVKTAKHAIAQYPPGHVQAVEALRKNLDLWVCGSSYDGVGINDCIASSHRCYEAFLVQTQAQKERAAPQTCC